MKGYQRGFTLLELLVVITLIGLIAGVVAPRFINLGDKLTLKNQRLEVRQKINGLPLLALRNGAALRIDANGAPLALPEGWRVTAKTPVIYQSNGSCLGGLIEVWQGDSHRDSIPLQPPLCQWSS
jgi:general secretion pathway protein G